MKVYVQFMVFDRLIEINSGQLTLSSSFESPVSFVTVLLGDPRNCETLHDIGQCLLSCLRIFDHDPSIVSIVKMPKNGVCNLVRVI